MERRFRDRSDAGRRLAAHLANKRSENPIVMGLARGGIVVAAEVAKAVGAPLDVMVVRKVGAPGNEEFGIGAVGPECSRSFDEQTVKMLGLTEADLERLATREEVEVRRRLDAYRGDRPEPDMTDRTVIIVDDGLATGVTAETAARYARSRGARHIVFATPVCSPTAALRITQYVDELACLCTPEAFCAVGQWYEEFDQTADAEVKALLAESQGGGYLA